MSPKEDSRLRELVKELVNTINFVFSDSQEIKDVIKSIEDEGYQVDIILASITKILKKRDPLETRNVPALKQLKYEFNSFDKEFLKSIKVRLDNKD
ncbi:MAG: hypothetical protein ACE5EA_08910 [Nitrospirota bacterium]